MQIQFNTDRSIEGNEKLAEEVEAIVSNGLDRFSAKITRLEIHLSDANSDKKSGAKDMRCLLEARLAGMQPISVSHQAPTVAMAVESAVDKLKRSLDSTLGRLSERQ